MKKPFKLLVLALAAALPLIVSCTSGQEKEGKPYDELPTLQEADILTFFKALPEQVLPDRIKAAEDRERYFKSFMAMVNEGILADGEGPEETVLKTGHSVYWSDFIDSPEDYDPDVTVHPYRHLHVFPGLEKGSLFGILESGSYNDGEDRKDPVRSYWLDTAGGTLSEATVKFDPAYTEDDLTEDVLLSYGSDDLFYAVKNKQFIEYFHDRGAQIILENVGPTGVFYEWNGVKFVRAEGMRVPCIYNYGFANIMLGNNVPYNIRGCSLNQVETDNYYETVNQLVKDGDSEPTLVFHNDADGKIFMIEVCKGLYSNPYGIYPGMPVEEFYALVKKINSRFEEEPYVSVNDSGEDFVEIYAGFDEDFIYKVGKDQYLGDEKFAPGAIISRVVVYAGEG